MEMIVHIPIGRAEAVREETSKRSSKTNKTRATVVVVVSVRRRAVKQETERGRGRDLSHSRRSCECWPSATA